MGAKRSSRARALEDSAPILYHLLSRPMFLITNSYGNALMVLIIIISLENQCLPSRRTLNINNHHHNQYVCGSAVHHAQTATPSSCLCY